MDATGALQSLLEITLFGQLDPGPQLPAAPATTGTPGLAVGQFVTAQVLATSGPTTLVAIAGQPFRLNLPQSAEVGQSIDFQVLQSEPELQLRMVTDARLDPPAAAEVALTGGSAGVPADEALPAVPVTAADGTESAALASTQLASGAPLVAAAPGNPSLVVALATQLRNAMSPPTLDGRAPLVVAARSTPSEALEASTLGATAANDPANDPANSTSAGAAIDFASSQAAAPAGAASLASSAAAGPGSSAAAAGLPATPAPTTLASAISVAAANASSPTSGGPAAIPLPGGGVLWSGPVWPGQDLEVRIEPDQHSAAFEPPALNNWRAEMRLTLPALGEVRASLSWTTGGLRIGIATGEASSADALRGDAATLLANLRSLDIRVHALGISHGT